MTISTKYNNYILFLILLLTIVVSITVNGQSLILEKLGSIINTPTYQEINPITDEEGKLLFFTRTGSPEYEKTLIVDGKDLSKELPLTKYQAELATVYQHLGSPILSSVHRSAFNQDVWFARSVDGELFNEVKHPGPPLNNALPNSICSYTPEKDVFVIINQFPAEGGMKKGFSTIKMINDSIWESPKPLMIDQFFTESDIISFNMSKNGQVAIMSLERSDSRGSNDLYVSFRLNDSLWSAPKNMGNINSTAKEITPFLSEDLKTIYFSSNRFGSMGGFDIYLSNRMSNEWDDWSEPLPMIDPINSPSDDIQPYFNTFTGYLYFASRRDGSSDIYRIRISEPKPPKITILGKIIDSKTLRPVEASIYIGREGGDNYQKVIPSPDGEFTAVVDRKEKLKFFPFKDKYVSRVEIIDVDSLETYDNVSQLNIYIDQKAVNSRISLNPIYFLQSKPIILEKSYKELKRLVALLKDNPNVYIKIEGHTDNQGNPDDLQKLSEDRALAVKFFLEKEGIDSKRLETKGYGAKRPITNNSNLQQRELNRRVEFIITKIL